MGKKATEKQKHIITQAEAVFAAKGFKNVTMQDIVAACGISRGGIYLYFKDTAELFRAVLQMRAQSEQALPGQPPEACPSAKVQMERFLQGQKNELLHPARSLIIATYEYLFAQRDALDPAQLNAKFKDATRQLGTLIAQGVEQGEFFVEPRAAAQNIVLLLEGLRISSTVLVLEEDFLDGQMKYLLSQLIGGRNEST